MTRIGGVVIDFVVNDHGDWPSYTGLDADRSEQATLISNSSLTINARGEYVAKHLLDDPESKAEFVGELYIDEAAIHLPPYRTEMKAEIQEALGPAKNWALVWGQRRGFGINEPEWGITPHLFTDEAEIGPTLALIKRASRFVADHQPMSGTEIVEERRAIRAQMDDE